MQGGSKVAAALCSVAALGLFGSACSDEEACAAGQVRANGNCVASGASSGTGASDGGFPPGCGDGFLTTDEACEPSDEDLCRTCDETCHVRAPEPVCGDGLLCVGTEACDDGNRANGDWCSADCTTGGFCQADEEATLLDGTTQVDAAPDLVAICAGRVLVANPKSKSLDRLDINAGFEGSFALEQAPTALLLDASLGHVYVGEDAAPGLERLDLGNGATQAIALPAGVLGLARSDTLLFATLDDATPALERSLAVVDVASAAVVAVVAGKLGEMIVYDRKTDALVTGDRGYAGALRRFTFDAATQSLSLAEEVTDVGVNCRDLAISANGEHLAYACQAGNDGAYAVFDFDPADLANRRGHWASTINPRGVAFTPDGARLLVGGDSHLVHFDVATHAVLSDNYSTGCWRPRSIRFGPGGRALYGMDDCPHVNQGMQELWYSWMN